MMTQGIGGSKAVLETSEPHGLSWARWGWATGLSVVIALAATEAIFKVASALGALDSRVVLPSVLGMGPLGPASVAATAVIATVLAAVVLGVLGLATRRPIRKFRIAATVLGVLSLSMPATIIGPPLSMRVVLSAMHVVVFLVSVGVLATLAQRPQEA